jgi:hypothetical protein
MTTIKEFYDSKLNALLCRVVIVPRKLQPELRWKITSTQTSEILKTRPEPETNKHVPIYDLSTKSWVQVLAGHIESVEYLLFNEFVEWKEVEDEDSTIFVRNPAGGDPEEIPILGKQKICTITPGGWISSGCQHENFDHEGYYAAVEKYIDNMKDRTGDDPWLVNFHPLLRPIWTNWKKMIEILYPGSAKDLLDDTIDMKRSSEYWNKLIIKHAEEAKEFLHETKASRKKEVNWLDAIEAIKGPLVENSIENLPEGEDMLRSDLDDMEWDQFHKITRDELLEKLKNHREDLHEEIDEVDVIIKLIDEQVEEYMEMSNACDNLYDLRDVWPPILLPMPFRYESGFSGEEPEVEHLFGNPEKD